ncbi:DUF5694 domain-containing protein [Priestia taiwanensis]|uniref:Uncharacterized protein n=1 Tax=Priestia taiwanensis TaxID=1347902 RepID=A0A917AS25_9BACI|nr:DUF5694 domain-containing protein [Priestia taiwanensis]MBM7363926.1 hypothetical protein [Priestia taiwanensis]GGE70188.1 hypothetical protein GCM10007140_20170 [Priestia taiwanensis]
MSKPTIFLLGTNHFSNHDNGDLIQMKTDDMLSEKRQQHIQEVIGCLKEFRPTKVAIEWPKELQPEYDKQYHAYLNDDFQLSQNKSHQIGFRLAKEMRHDTIFAVDWNKEIEGVPNIGTWTKENPSEHFDKLLQVGKQETSEIAKYFATHTIREFLVYLNKEERIQATQQFYAQLMLLGREEEPVGAQWTANYWHYRNMLIYKNIMELITSNEERIFVLYGAGHLPLLLQFLRESNLCHVEVASNYLI